MPVIIVTGTSVNSRTSHLSCGVMRGPWAVFSALLRQSDIIYLLAEGCSPGPPVLSLLSHCSQEKEMGVKVQALKSQVWERSSPKTVE